MANLAALFKPLVGKNAIVTGSTSGIGLAIAKTLAAAGCRVVLNGFGEANAIEQVRSGIEKEYNVKVAYHPADLSKPKEVEALVHDAGVLLGSNKSHVDILINNGGIQFVSSVEKFPSEKWDAILAINLSSAFHATQTALPGMRERGWGRIINVASVHGLVASAGKSAYVASKHGIVGFTKSLALEIAGSGVTANSICPGWVLTPLVQAQIDARMKENNLSLQAATDALLSEKQPSKQFAKPEDIGALAAFLCTDYAAQITGASIPVDGGWTAQ